MKPLTDVINGVPHVRAIADQMLALTQLPEAPWLDAEGDRLRLALAAALRPYVKAAETYGSRKLIKATKTQERGFDHYHGQAPQQGRPR